MKNALIGAVVVGIALAQSAEAQTPMKVRPAKMTCEDFIAVDDNYKPALVYWAEGTDHAGIKETDELTVDTANPVAIVIEECKKTPKMTFLGKVKHLVKSGRLVLMTHENNP
jgi:acid stress chaperone HdeA